MTFGSHAHPLSLQREEARARRDLLSVERYDVSLDLTGEETFTSRTVIDVSSRGGHTFMDLRPVSVAGILLDGSPVDVGLLARGRLPLDLSPGPHRVEVEATMPFRNDGEGLHLHVDPADGQRYIYGMSFMDAAPTIFACFDQPDLKAPYAFHVRAPESWTVVGNAPGTQVEAGQWEFETTPPLSTYFVTLVAGPYHVLRDSHDGIALGLSARQSLAGALDADADELFSLTKACFDEYHRLFGIRYAFGDYHQAFVPEFNAGAMENPGCVTYRDPLLFPSRVTRGVRVQRAKTLAHEMAHQWFGNLVTPQWWDDLWLNESFAEYLGNRVTADVTDYTDAWVHGAYTRRQWGLGADQRPSTHPVAGNGAVDATAALQDFDGISYTKGASILKQLNARMGDETFLAGVVDHFDRHRFGNATMHDLFASWTRAGAEGLDAFTSSWLRTAGPDTLAWDRGAGVVRRTPPPDHPADRTHVFRAALAGQGRWRTETVTVTAPETVFAPAADAVVLDPYEETWAATVLDAGSLEHLVRLLPDVTDQELRAGTWNNVRTGFDQGRVHPDAVVDLLVATAPTEPQDVALTSVVPWALRTVVGLCPSPTAAAARLHGAFARRTATAQAGSSLQLAAFRAAVATCSEASALRGWLAGEVPEGLALDLDLRWHLLVRLAVLGEVSRQELDTALAEEPTATSRVEHARAVASLPLAEAKEWAWQRFTGAADVPNYELEAAGLGMWRSGQEALTRPYVARFFDALPDLPRVHSGWVLGTAMRSFFPFTSLDEATVARADALLEGDLDPTVRRNLVDQTHDLRGRLATRALVAEQR